MFKRKSLLAKLLAKENLTVIREGSRTASFDVVNRVLRLPLWSDMSDDMYDLLEGHEVGHALFTPADGWHHSTVNLGINRSFVNIIEDIRIERLILDMYPGLYFNFIKGYKELLKGDFFGLSDRPISSLGFMDRLNIKSKSRNLLDVEFTAEELPYYELAMSVSTFDDVIAACQTIAKWLDEKKEDVKPKLDEKDNAVGGESPSDSSDEDGESGGESPSDSSDEDGESSDEDNETSDSSDEDGGSSDEDNETSDSSDEDGGSPEKSDGSGHGTTGDEASSIDEGNDDSETYTDDMFHKNEDKLVSTNEWGELPTVYEGLDKSFEDNNVIPQKELQTARQYQFDRNLKGMFKNKILRGVDNFKKFEETNKKIVAVMAREFEMKKAANESKRTSESKSGVLDISKLHNYKFTEDIFLSNTNVADAKSHGMVAIIDFSGSMMSVIGNVVEQAIVLAMFCRKVNIPFDIYSFTACAGYAKPINTIAGIDGLSYVGSKNIKVINQLSSNMSNAYFKEVTRLLYLTHNVETSECMMTSDDWLGSTPLNETLIYMTDILEEFKRKHNIQKLNFVTITDGVSNYMRGQTGHSLRGKRGNTYLKIRGKYVSINLSDDDGRYQGGRESTSGLLEYIKGTGVNTIGYFVVNNADSARRHILSKMKGSSKNMDKCNEFKSDKIAVITDIPGYNTYFVIDGRMKATSDNLKINDSAKKREILREFKRFSKSKKMNRQLAVKFAIAVS